MIYSSFFVFPSSSLHSYHRVSSSVLSSSVFTHLYLTHAFLHSSNYFLFPSSFHPFFSLYSFLPTFSFPKSNFCLYLVFLFLYFCAFIFNVFLYLWLFFSLPVSLDSFIYILPHCYSFPFHFSFLPSSSFLQSSSSLFLFQILSFIHSPTSSSFPSFLLHFLLPFLRSKFYYTFFDLR